MQDRFLFRGKHVISREWVCGDLSTINISSDTLIYVDVNNDYRVDPATVGQCTGLRDRNGKLIFEGDILKTWDGFLYEVIFRSSKACFWAYRNADDNCSLAGHNGSGIEIIGNIHDNPELLAEVWEWKD